MKENQPVRRLDTLAPLAATFGAAPVSPAERQRFVRKLFDQVAPRYDLMNDLMSFGLHRLWKRRAVAAAAASPGAAHGTIIDLAGGTGDLALTLKRRCPAAHIIVVDASPGMLAVARARGGILLGYQEAAGEDLPFPAASAEAVMLSFGLRNMTDPPRVLREVARVLKPGGRLVLLEFSKPQSWFAPIYDAFSKVVIPSLGALISGNRAAYRYLVESISLFPDAASISRELTAAGFGRVHCDRLMFGVAALHVAGKA